MMIQPSAESYCPVGQPRGPVIFQRVCVVLVTTLILAGCAKQTWDPDTDPNMVACRSTYGFTPGTPNFDKCMEKFKEIDAQKK